MFPLDFLLYFFPEILSGCPADDLFKISQVELCDFKLNPAIVSGISPDMSSVTSAKSSPPEGSSGDISEGIP